MQIDTNYSFSFFYENLINPFETVQISSQVCIPQGVAACILWYYQKTEDKLSIERFLLDKLCLITNQIMNTTSLMKMTPNFCFQKDSKCPVSKFQIKSVRVI